MDIDASYYSIAEVASHLSLSIKTIRRHIASGDLEAAKIGSVYRIPKRAVEHFINGIKDNPKVAYDLFGEPICSTIETKRKNATKLTDNVNWIDISQLWDNPQQTDYTFVDLFCGAGGLSKGLELAGLQGICGLDWFKEAGMTYRRNFHHTLVEGDITQPEVKDLFYKTCRENLNGRQLTLVAGGFPCQGFSMAGNRIVDDPRNSLYKELLEIVRTLQPLYVVCENVVGLRTMLGGGVERKIISDFREAGYEMNVTTLRAANYYVPQKRDRVIFIGNRIGATNYHPHPLLSPDRYISTGEAIGDLISHPIDEGFNHLPTKHSPEMEARISAVPEGQSLYKGYSDAWKKCPWDEASCTIKENHGGVNLHPKLPRVLTAREMARLQSFPDDFIFEGKKNKQLVQIGNAVPPLLGKAIGLSVIKSLMDIDNMPTKI
ncbi:MAG: DNA cytosine methyltransferase [Alistipes sp.]|nr:DNA cytosine methyltransferase [Alistipes sp.]